jgi:GntR family transcriptional regulator
MPSPQIPIALDRSSPMPLWAQLANDLRRRVEAGGFAEAFPSEMDLVEAYGVSRNTVREALRRLRGDGVVIAGRGRRPRLGGQVAIEQPLGALYSLHGAIEAAGLAPRSVVRAQETRQDEEIAQRLEVPADAPLIYLERLRLADDEPLAVDRLWFPLEIASPLLGIDLSAVGFYDELASRTGLRLTGGREQLHAAVPSRAERSLLQLPAGVAVFTIDRLGLVVERPVEWRTTMVRGDRFMVSAAFGAGIGYRLDVGVVTG